MSNASRSSANLKPEDDISNAEKKRLNDLVKDKKVKGLLNHIIKKGGKTDGIKLKKD